MDTDPTFAAPGRFWRGNLHTHSDRSDGKLSPEAVCATYREAGYDFLALTDHFLPRYGFPISDTRPFRTRHFTTLLGAEVHAPATSLGEAWHILAVGLPEDFAPTPPDETGAALGARCVAAGAFVAIAHPAWYQLTLEDAASLPGAHAVEIYNHTSQVRTSRGDSTGFVDDLLASGRRIAIAATDDAHFACEDFFGAWAMVKAEANEPEALLAALKLGHHYATQGPLIEGITWDEEEVEVTCSPAAAIIALGRGSRAVQRVSDGITRASLPLQRLREGGYARIVVRDAAGRCAWAQPRFW
jgi:hypothetical protein